jgi:voltage-dependent calcium channel
VEEAVRRNTVVGFFNTLYYSRRFRRRAASSGNSRIGAPPQMSVPEIFVENPDEAAESGMGTVPRDFTENAPVTPSRGAQQRASASSDYALGRSLSTATSIGRSDSRSDSAAELDSSPKGSPYHAAAQRLQAVDTSYHGARARSESVGRLSPSPSAGHSRQGSSVSALGMLDSLDNSAWGESIRRSFTMRRPNSPS